MNAYIDNNSLPDWLAEIYSDKKYRLVSLVVAGFTFRGDNCTTKYNTQTFCGVCF